MAILNITGQPLHFGGIKESDFTCQRPSPYCALFKQSEDTIRHQFLQTPCGESLICNGEFEASETLIVNGDFNGNADNWTLTPGSGSLAYSGGKVVHSGDLSSLSQSIASLIVGQSYVLTFTVSNMIDVDSSISASLGGGASSGFYTSDGTYTVTLVAGNSNDLLVFAPLEDVTIDNIVLTSIDCWSGDGWDIGSGSACHLPGNTDSLLTTLTESIAINDYYVIAFSVFSMTDGNLEIYLGGELVDTITENGDYTRYYTIIAPTDNDLQFLPSTDFDGCITTASVYQLLNGNDVLLSTAIVDLDGFFIDYAQGSVHEDRVYLNKEAYELQEGCYKMVMFDPCAPTPSDTIEVNADVPFNSTGTWDVGHAVTAIGQEGSIVVTGGKLVQAFNSTNITNNVYHHITQDYNWPVGISGAYFTVTVQTGAWSHTTGANIYLLLPGGTLSTQLFQINPITGTVAPNTTYTRSFFAFFNNDPGTIFQITPSTTTPLTNKFGIMIGLGGHTSGETQELVSFSVQYAGVYPGTSYPYLESNCFKIAEDTGNAQLMRGVFDENHSYGLVFETNIFPYVQQRLFLSFTNPHNPGKSGNFLQSNSVKRKIFSQRDYAFDLTIHATDIITHRAVNTMMDADHFYIGASASDLIEYNSEEKDYSPDYGKKGESPVGEAVIEVTRVDTSKFNLNQ